MTTKFNRRIHRERRSFWSRINRLLDTKLDIDTVVGIVLVTGAITGALVAWLL